MKSLVLLWAMLFSFSPLVTAAETDVLNQARLEFEKGRFEKARELYSQVPKSSDYWLLALEEQAWSYIREQRYEKALGMYHTLSTEAFAPQASPETYLIGAYAGLRICDYKLVFEVSRDFKKAFKPKLGALGNITKTISPDSQELFSFLQSGNTKRWSDMGRVAIEKWPSFVNKDKALLSAVKARDFSKAQLRLFDLAQRDIKAIGKITKKMRIVEVEALQRMNLQNSPEVASQGESISDDDDTIYFEKEKDDVWIDEITRYRVKTKGCVVRKAQSKVGQK